MSDREPITPRVSASYAVFRREAELLAEGLEVAGARMRRRLDMLDIRGAEKADALAVEMHELAERFAAWPVLPAEVVAAERTELTARFLEVADRAVRLLEGLPSHPVLGAPRAHR